MKIKSVSCFSFSLSRVMKRTILFCSSNQVCQHIAHSVEQDTGQSHRGSTHIYGYVSILSRSLYGGSSQYKNKSIPSRDIVSRLIFWSIEYILFFCTSTNYRSIQTARAQRGHVVDRRRSPVVDDARSFRFPQGRR
jgi:hypothetical protein